jgi:hypothetical protein
MQSPRVASRQPGSKVTQQSPELAKQYSSIDSTEEGMQIDCSDEQSLNADALQTVMLERGSNVTAESALQKQKH